MIVTTRAVVDRSLTSQMTDPSVIAENAVFSNLATGVEYRGIEAIQGLFITFTRTAFDASMEVHNVIYGHDKAAVEGALLGRHIGEYEGILPTGKPVRVPIAFFYTLENGKIQSCRMYFEIFRLLGQLTAGET